MTIHGIGFNPDAEVGSGAASPKGGAPGATFAFAAAKRTVSEDVYLASVAGGGVYIPLSLSPTISVAAVTLGTETTNTHAWLNVVWDTSYLPTTATLTFGTAWPASAYSVDDKYVNVPVAFISTDELVQALTGNLTLSPTFVSGGVILAPASI